jgi:subtilisin-like proprotein convertase family protein
MWRSDFVVCLFLVAGCGGESEATGSTGGGGNTSDAGTSDGAAGTNGDGGGVGGGLNVDAWVPFEGGSVCRAAECVGPNTVFTSEFSSSCSCEPSYVDTDPRTCSATCVALPLDAVHVSVSVEHPAVGDLTIKLLGPDASQITLLNRPGFAETSDDGADGAGALAASSTSQLVRFWQSANVDAEQMGAGAPAGSPACPNSACTWKPAAGAAGGSTLDAFVGQLGQGDWTVCIGDSNPGQTGTLGSVNVELLFPNEPPHPGSKTLGIPIPDDAYDGTVATMACGIVSF